jgi:hypothetical protein
MEDSETDKRQHLLMEKSTAPNEGKERRVNQRTGHPSP